MTIYVLLKDDPTKEYNTRQVHKNSIGATIHRFLLVKDEAATTQTKYRIYISFFRGFYLIL